MKASQLQELRGLSVAELRQKARETKEELFNLRFALRTGHLSDFSKVRAIRRTYAQIQTIIAQKQLAEARRGAA